jgi:rod shape-determining protein MreC
MGLWLWVKMNNYKPSSKLAKKVQGAIAACLLPVFFLYILLDKPDYKIMDSMSGVIVPAARAVGDGITWPVRAFGKLRENLKVRSGIRAENRELRAKLDEMIAQQTTCNTLLAENQRLEQALDIVRSVPHRSIMARVIYENSIFTSNTFTLDKGENSGVKVGAAVLTKDGFFAGVVISTTANSANVRGIRDAGANTPVRVSGTDVMGFLRGRGNAEPVFELFSDQEFTPTIGIMLLTSGAGGNLPDGIPVGKIKSVGDEKSAPVAVGAKTMSEAIVIDSR